MIKPLFFIALLATANAVATEVPVAEDEGACKCNRISMTEAEFLEMKATTSDMPVIGAYLDDKTGKVVVVGEAEARSL